MQPLPLGLRKSQRQRLHSPPFDCQITSAAAKAGIGSSWWHYADYCDTCDNCVPVEEGKSWGACITGWG